MSKKEQHLGGPCHNCNNCQLQSSLPGFEFKKFKIQIHTYVAYASGRDPNGINRVREIMISPLAVAPPLQGEGCGASLFITAECSS